MYTAPQWGLYLYVCPRTAFWPVRGGVTCRVSVEDIHSRPTALATTFVGPARDCLPLRLVACVATPMVAQHVCALLVVLSAALCVSGGSFGTMP